MQRKAAGSADSAVGTVIAGADGSGEVSLEVIAGSAVGTVIWLSGQQGEAAAKAVVAIPRTGSISCSGSWG